MDFDAARRAMVDSQLRPQAVTDPRLIAAMARVPRERFVPVEQQAFAYIDRVIPLANGRGMSPAASLGRLLNELKPRPGERALVVGGGTGYAAALLADMGLSVTVTESDPDMLGKLRHIAGIRVVDGGLEEGAPGDAPFDVILVDGEVEALPDALVDQLAIGGRLGTGIADRGVSRLMSGTRSVHGFGLKSIADAAMAPLPGFARPAVFTF